MVGADGLFPGVLRRRTGPVHDLVLWLFRAAAQGAEVPPTVWRGSDADTAGLAAALDRHRGWTLLARRQHLVEGLPEEAVQRAVQVRRRAAGHQLAVESDLSTCGRALDEAGIPWLCVKGPVLDAVYRRTGDSRASTDLDLLVGPADFPRALQALGTTGTALLNRNWELLRRVLPGEVAMRAPQGTTIDLHWSLVHKASSRRRTRLVTEGLLSTASRADLGSQQVPVLEPARALVHLCLHAAGSGGDRLFWLLDVALQSQDPALDWRSAVAVAREWRAEVAVGLVLDRTHRRLGADVPRWVVPELLGRRGWAVLDRLVGAATDRRLDGETRLPALVCVAALEHGSPAGWLVTRAGRRRDRGRVRPFVQSPSDPGSALYPSGTEEDLAAYLRAVAGEAAR